MAVTLPASSRARTEAEPLRAVDLLLLGYLVIVSIVAALRLRENPAGWWLLLAHGLFAVLLFLITRPGLGPVGRTIREIYPLLLLPALYSELDILNPEGARVYDDVVQRWELLLFGSQISQEWWRSSPSRFWSNIFHAAYLSYYLIISAPALYFAWQGDLQAVRRFVLIVITTFVICYLAFIFFPVAGPYYQFPRPDGWMLDNLSARLTYEALATGSSYGAAFPSSHVAAALAASLAALRSSRGLGLVLLVPTLLLTLGVVYCQMHYAVDAVGGVAVGLLVTWLVNKSVIGHSEQREREKGTA